LHALSELGWSRHPRFQEAIAWLDEGSARSQNGGWPAVARRGLGRECPVTAVAALAALAASGETRRESLSSRAELSLKRILEDQPAYLEKLSHPSLGRTDLAEILWVLARVGSRLSSPMTAALERLQRKQDEGARWRIESTVPKTLAKAIPVTVGEPSGWLTLKALVAIMHYGVEANLPRLYPEKPRVS
jgi:hypothetical protein